VSTTALIDALRAYVREYPESAIAQKSRPGQDADSLERVRREVRNVLAETRYEPSPSLAGPWQVIDLQRNFIVGQNLTEAQARHIAALLTAE